MNAEAELGFAHAHKHGTQRIIGAGRNGFHAIVALFLDAAGNMPSGIKRFHADFVFAQIGLRHRLTHGHGIHFGELAVGVEKKTLLRNVDHHMLAFRHGRKVGERCVCICCGTHAEGEQAES